MGNNGCMQLQELIFDRKAALSKSDESHVLIEFDWMEEDFDVIGLLAGL